MAGGTVSSYDNARVALAAERLRQEARGRIPTEPQMPRARLVRPAPEPGAFTRAAEVLLPPTAPGKPFVVGVAARPRVTLRDALNHCIEDHKSAIEELERHALALPDSVLDLAMPLLQSVTRLIDES